MSLSVQDSVAYNQLLNEDSLSDTSTSEETNLSTTSVRGEQIDDLDTSNQHLSGGGLVDEFGSVSVDRSQLGGLDGTTLIDRVTGDVHDTAESAGTDGDSDGVAGIEGFGTTSETFGTWEVVSMHD